MQCFRITGDANITHVFIDVDSSCLDDPNDYLVFVDGVEETMLHDQGGPCQRIDRDVWFPLTGNQCGAQVCLQFKGCSPDKVSIGWKVNNECMVESAPGCGGLARGR